MKVLVIDDDADARETVQMSLQIAGMQVTAAASGPEGLAKALTDQPDVILLDVMMPHVDGPATLKALKANPETRPIPVVFLTASAQRSETEQLLAQGAVAVFAKPFEPMALAKRVREVFERTPQRPFKPRPAVLMPSMESPAPPPPPFPVAAPAPPPDPPKSAAAAAPAAVTARPADAPSQTATPAPAAAVPQTPASAPPAVLPPTTTVTGNVPPRSMEELRYNFIQRSLAKIVVARQWVETLRENPADEPTLRELMRFFHSLAGMGGSHGFTQVTRLGREGELECMALLKASAKPGSEDADRWRRLVDALEREFAEPGTASQAAAAVAASVPGAETPGSVLVVSADPDVHGQLTPLLLAEGFIVKVASSGAEARPHLSEELPSALVVDVDLPDGSGHELIAFVRGQPGGDGVPIVVTSPRAGFLDKVDAVTSGADGYFEKPVDWKSLLRRLQHVLESGQPQPATILSVEDDPEQAEYLKSVLESAGHRVLVCQHPSDFESMLHRHQPDVVLMDILLPGVTGYDLVRYLRQDERYATLPVLFLTTEGQLQSRYRTARVGGDDHLVKPVVPALLLSAVAARIERARFLRQLLSRDGLTRLLTHSAFSEAAAAIVRRREQEPGAPVAWVMVDVDHFKKVNDSYGHPVGDRVLTSLAALLRRRLRQSDQVGRYGGEEFAILVENLPEPEVVRLVERLLAEFGATKHVAADGTTFSCTFSSGVAMLQPGMGLDQWKKLADDALYVAKNNGRNRVECAGAQKP